MLESAYRNLPNTYGNVDAAIAMIADSIRKLSSISPPEGLYKDISDSQLAETALEEANKMEEKANKAMKELASQQPPSGAVRFFFYSDFKQCCLNQVEYLRTEMLRRLGPSAYDTDEMRTFNGDGGLTGMERHPDGALSVVQRYAPYFRSLSIKLKRKALPLRYPTALNFSETRITPKPPFSYSLLVTIETKKEATSGYIIVQFDARVGGVSCDFADSKLVFQSDVIDNEEVSRLLTWNSATTTYALRIGGAPFRPQQPIHVVALAGNDFHVSKVLLFDE
jgi:hypothetical protein